jgi:hypothetical protein
LLLVRVLRNLDRAKGHGWPDVASDGLAPQPSQTGRLAPAVTEHRSLVIGRRALESRVLRHRSLLTVIVMDHCALVIAHSSLIAARWCPFVTAHIAHCSLATGDWSLLIAHWSLLIGHCSLVTAHCSLLIAHCALVTAHSLPPAHSSFELRPSSFRRTAPAIPAHCAGHSFRCFPTTPKR